VYNWVRGKPPEDGEFLRIFVLKITLYNNVTEKNWGSGIYYLLPQ